MEALLELLQKYWIFPAGVAVLAGPAFVSYIKQKIGNVQLPKLPKLNFGKNKSVVVVIEPVAANSANLVAQDIAAIQWLANRAVDVNDGELILELENVNKKFFHIHRVMRKPAVDSSVVTK